MRRSALAFILALLAHGASAQQINDVQLRPGSSTLWGAAFNTTGVTEISQYNTSGSVVDSFRWLQGSSVANSTFLFSVSPTGTIVGPATGGRMGAGTVNATGYYQNGVAISGGGTPGGTNGQIQYNNAGAFGGFTTSGDATINTGTGALTLATVNSDTGTWGSATLCAAFNVNAKGLITAAAQSTCTPAIGSITGLGTGVATALATNIGSAGAPVLFNGAGGTPTSLVGTNITGTAAGLTAGTANAVAVGGITGLGSNVSTWLATPSSANLRSALTDETGTGLAYFQGGDIGTPSAGVGSNLTALNASNISSGTLNSARLAWNSAILSGNPSNPTGTASVSAVMMGLGVTTCRFTPTFSTRVEFVIEGQVSNTGANATALRMRYGTGAGPANGAAATGTAMLTGDITYTSTAAGANLGFYMSDLITGLSAGTTYWFDLTAFVNAGTGNFSNVHCTAKEI